MTDAMKREQTIKQLKKKRGLTMSDEEAAAQGCFVVIRRGKRRVIRALERILYPVVRAWERLRPGPSKTSDVVQKILVVEYSLLGDVILLLPFLQNLRAHYPSAHITLLVNPSVLKLLQNQDLADEVVPVRMPWVEYSSRLRKWNPFSPLYFKLGRNLFVLRRQHFDLAFSVRGDVRDNFMLWFTGAERSIGYAFGGGVFFLTDAVPPDLDHPHISDRWLRLLDHLGKPLLERRPRLKLSRGEVEFAERYLSDHGIRDGDIVIGIHPRARLITRQWNEQNFRAIAERLVTQFSAKILWFYDPQNGRQAETDTNGTAPVRLPLREFMAVLSRCRFLVCNEGGPMHIATALGVPVVAVFGSTEPAWYGPRADQGRIVIRPDFWCRPCGDQCIFDEPYCIRSISIEQVYAAAEETLGKLVSQEVPLRR